VPSEECRRLDDREGLPPREPAREQDEREPEPIRGPPWLHLSFAVQGQLLPEKEILSRQRRLRLEADLQEPYEIDREPRQNPAKVDPQL
jgi:hypothetical protein